MKYPTIFIEHVRLNLKTQFCFKNHANFTFESSKDTCRNSFGIELQRSKVNLLKK